MTCRLRLTVSVLLCAIAFLIAGTVVVSAASYMLGDADQDQDVSIIDATAVLRSVAGTKEITGAAVYAADVNGNSLIEVIDATLIQRWLADMNTSYSIGTQFEIPTEAPTIAPTIAPTEAPTAAPTARPTDADGWGTDIYRP